MTQGIFIEDVRPKSKKQIKEYVDRAYTVGEHEEESEYLSRVYIEATSMFGNEYDGSLASMPITTSTIYFVGPDPHTKRNFYGTLEWNKKKSRWVVK